MNKTGNRRRRWSFLIGPIIILAGLLVIRAQEKEPPKNPITPERLYHTVIPGDTAWVDTGLDVIQGQEIIFRASGGIRLQRGNPIALCGPDGYGMTYVHQPIQDKNLGALIGKVVRLISVEVDEETGEETRTEETELFFIGSESLAAMPIEGRLYLGINELVTADNAGQYEVNYYLRRYFDF